MTDTTDHPAAPAPDADAIMALADEFAEQSRIDGFDYPATQSENYSGRTKAARATLESLLKGEEG